jgi:hypothetical protein
MFIHFRAGIDPLMTAWDFCILYGKPDLTHGACVEDIMVRYHCAAACMRICVSSDTNICACLYTFVVAACILFRNAM